MATSAPAVWHAGGREEGHLETTQRKRAERVVRKALVWADACLPPLLWMAFIASLSTDSFSSARTSHALEGFLRACAPGLLARLTEGQLEWMHFAVRKLAHLSEYAILAMLLHRAQVKLGRRRCLHTRAVAWIGAVLWAAGDEVHQAYCANRTPAAADVLLDGAGALLALTAVWLWERKRAKCHSTSVCLNSSSSW